MNLATPLDDPHTAPIAAVDVADRVLARESVRELLVAMQDLPGAQRDAPVPDI